MEIKKSLLSENFVSTERGMMVIEGGQIAKFHRGCMAARRHRSWLSEAL